MQPLRSVVCLLLELSESLANPIGLEELWTQAGFVLVQDNLAFLTLLLSPL